ncbi:hypothetical protein ACTWP5_23560 [Streptomyces sp. 4N509B]|uniref:hypothetical protein n=1 Tax=Streptomyces sp. 4N509B TaxID=3457413 RepID=UPI003FD0C707
MRASGVGAALAVGLALTAGASVATAATAATAASAPAVASDVGVMDYWHLWGHYPTEQECVAVGESYVPERADGYACQPKDGGWDLYLIFAT